MSRWLPSNATIGHGDHGGACCDNCAKGKACKAPCVSGRWQGSVVADASDSGISWGKVAAGVAIGSVAVLALGGHPFAWVAGKKVFP